MEDQMESFTDKPSMEMLESELAVELGEALVTAEDPEADDAPSEDEASRGRMKRMEFILPFGNPTSDDDDDFTTSSDSYYDEDDSMYSDTYYDEDDSMYSDDSTYHHEDPSTYSDRGRYRTLGGLIPLHDWTLKELSKLSDEHIETCTGFASYSHFIAFWQLIEPSVHKMVRVSRGPPPSQEEEEASGRYMRRTLPPVEELILYLAFLSMGREDYLLAYDCSIPPSTVNTIISLWTNFLYTFLGSRSSWLDAEHVRARLPADYKEDFPDAHLIVDTLEVGKKKALIGVAPHGPVTFISPLFEGSVSNEVLFRTSGLLDLLEEDSAIMVPDEELIIPECVKCKVYRPPSPTMPFCKPSDHTKKMIRFWNNAVGVILRVRDRDVFSRGLPSLFASSKSKIVTVAALLCNYQNAPLVGPYTRRGWE